jgi:hypothetical protein
VGLSAAVAIAAGQSGRAISVISSLATGMIPRILHDCCRWESGTVRVIVAQEARFEAVLRCICGGPAGGRYKCRADILDDPACLDCLFESGQSYFH